MDIFDAIDNNDTWNVRNLLEDGSVLSPNIRNEDGDTALFLASIHGDTDIVKILLEYNADPNIVNEDYSGNYTYEIPLFIAISKRYADIVKILLEYNADPDVVNEDYETPLFTASYYGFPDIV